MRLVATIVSALALVAVAAWAQTRPANPLALPRGCRDRSCVRERALAPASGGATPIFTSTSVSLAYPYTGADRIPSCTDARCVAVSGYGIADGGSQWQWIGQGGAQLAGTPTDPGTATLVNSFIWGAKALDIKAGNQAPYVISAAIDPIYGQAASSTLAVGYGRVAGRANSLNWWEDGYPGGTVGYFQMIFDATGATEGSAGYWSFLAAPGASATQAVTDAWGIPGVRYDGTNSCGNNTHGTIDTGDINLQSCATSRRSMDAGTHYVEGGSNNAANFLNGPLVTIARYNARLSDWDYGIVVDKAWGVFNQDQRPSYKQSTTVQGIALDNSTITGNVDVLWTKGPAARPNGLQMMKGYTNNWCSDPLDFSTCTPVGGTSINKNVVVGPFAAMKGGTAECDEILDTDAGAFEGYIGSEQISSPVPVPDDGGTRTSHYITADFFLRTGMNDGGQGSGWTFDQATAVWVTNGTQSLSSCAFTGLTSTPTRYSCSVELENPVDGGALSSAIPRLLVGTDAGQVGSIVACHGQTSVGPYSSPPWTTTTARPDNYVQLSPVGGLQDAGSWPTQLDGGAIEIVHVPLFHPNGISTLPDLGDPEYVFDAFLAAAQDHTIVMVDGYPPPDGGSGDCSILVGFRALDGGNSDFVLPGFCETAGHAYVTRAEWVKHGATAHCDDYVWRDDCGVPPALTANDSATVATWRAAMSAFTASCTSRTLVASDTTGTAYCPGLPDTVYLGNRLTANVPTSVNFLAVRVSQ